MKLGEILQAQEAWYTLQDIKKTPKTAYKLMRFGKLLSEEFKIILDQKNHLITEISTHQKNDKPLINKGSTEEKIFVQKYNEYLEIESDLEPLQITVEQLCDSLSENISDKLLILVSTLFK